ncbi:MAG TPA: cytochrome-c oxidase, cbb3-type subunit III [Albidovulum sp.]|uniref:cytochrome-c oxidase, cbb3-type subunit III n=1 Tax=Albidovulum sp. TaxID=1872424 RepID=UPI002BBC25EE|nr:cytochrome-c oxidase, cbb3-type subunit III [Albidovulum sp.]
MSGADDDRPVDPVTGYQTTGHNWNGIIELNTPMSRIAVWALVLAFLYSVVAWILLPAWPTGNHYTRGLLGLDQGAEAVDGYRQIHDARQGWMARFDDPDFAALAGDPAVMAEAGPAATRLFHDNCAACHGDDGGGGPGFPVLSDGYWMWGGDPATIAETIRVGINGTDPDTRISEMPRFDWMSREERAILADYVAGLPAQSADPGSPAAQLFADNCATCHGDTAAGGLDNGAPSLADASVIYGQDAETVNTTLWAGRHGTMPSWSGRLTPAEINLLALHVLRLSQGRATP